MKKTILLLFVLSILSVSTFAAAHEASEEDDITSLARKLSGSSEINPNIRKQLTLLFDRLPAEVHEAYKHFIGDSILEHLKGYDDYEIARDLSHLGYNHDLQTIATVVNEGLLTLREITMCDEGSLRIVPKLKNFVLDRSDYYDIQVHGENSLLAKLKEKNSTEIDSIAGEIAATVSRDGDEGTEALRHKKSLLITYFLNIQDGKGLYLKTLEG